MCVDFRFKKDCLSIYFCGPLGPSLPKVSYKKCTLIYASSCILFVVSLFSTRINRSTWINFLSQQILLEPLDPWGKDVKPKGLQGLLQVLDFNIQLGTLLAVGLSIFHVMIFWSKPWREFIPQLVMLDPTIWFSCWLSHPSQISRDYCYNADVLSHSNINLVMQASPPNHKQVVVS